MKNNNNSFADKMQAFTDLANSANADPADYEKALSAFARACASSVLRKVIDPKVIKTENGKKVIKGKTDKKTGKETATNSGFNPILVQMSRDISNNESALDRLVYAETFAYEYAFNSDGDLVRETVDADLAKAATDLLHENLADGLDLVNDAVVAILDEMQKQHDRDPSLPIDFERPYNKRVLNRKVWIKDSDNESQFKDIVTAPIREVYKHIRRSIQNSRAIALDPRNGYSYIEDFVTDGDSDNDPTVIYKRLPKYCDLGGYVCDFNGKETEYTVDSTAADIYNDVLTALDLTDRQRQILQYRLQGYGYKAISTRLGVTQRAIAKTVEQMQVKAEKIGFTPSMWQEMNNGNE